MASKQEQLIKEIGGLTVLELAQLVKALETEFGVSAAMPMMAAAPEQRLKLAELRLKKNLNMLLN